MIMFSKIKNTILTILVIICAVGLVSTLFKKCSGPDNKVFKQTLDSLHKKNDSLAFEIKKDSLVIDSLNATNNALVSKIGHQKAKIITIYQQVAEEKDRVSKLVDSGLISYFNKRYPYDTINDKLKIAQQVLSGAAEDLVDYDGAVKVLAIKDSIINLDSIRIAGKDTVISKYISKEGKYKKIIGNKDMEIMNWSSQYNKLEAENRKLKFKNKFQKIASYIIIGGLAYTMLHK